MDVSPFCPYVSEALWRLLPCCRQKKPLIPRPRPCVRKEENFNRGWKFVRRDEPQAYQSDFNDANWYNVSLPHDFSIPYFMEQKFYTGIGWYRKTFEVSAESASEQNQDRF